MFSELIHSVDSEPFIVHHYWGRWHARNQNSPNDLNVGQFQTKSCDQSFLAMEDCPSVEHAEAP